MFCPKCGIGNRVDQRFCRGCGHGLTGHRVALENNFEDAVEKIKSGSVALGLSAFGLSAISLMALLIWIFQNDAGAFFTLIPVLAFVIPGAILGLVRLNRARRVLRPKNRARGKGLGQSDTTSIELPAAAATDRLAEYAQAPVSVTENTTLNLKPRGRTSSEARDIR